MAKIADLTHARRDRMAQELATRLRAGAPNATVRVEPSADGTYDGVPLDVWRSAARKAGRSLGWRIRTFVSGQSVFLVDVRDSDDLTEAERNQRALRLQGAARAMDYLLQPRPDDDG